MQVKNVTRGARDAHSARVYHLDMRKRQLGKHYIKEWRLKRGLSLRQLSERLESEPGGDPVLSQMSLSRIERGLQPYNQETLEAIAFALGVQPSDLISVHPDVEGEVIDLLRHMGKGKQEQVVAVIRALAANGE